MTDTVFQQWLAKRSWKGIPLGFSVQKQIGKDVIFRLTPGSNTFYGNKPIKYQHKYPYFVPSSINNTASDWSRKVFKEAVHAWQDLAEEEKTKWNEWAEYADSPMSGYNLFIKERMTVAVKPDMKGVHHYIVSLGAGTSEVCTTISEVDPSKCIVLLDGISAIRVIEEEKATSVEVHPYVSSFTATQICLKWSVASYFWTSTSAAAIGVQIIEYM